MTFRLWKHNFETQFIKNAFVYHKRRVSFKQFFKQTFAFGQGRPLLNKKYPNTAKITYWFPTIFILSFLVSIVCLVIGVRFFAACFVAYFVLIFVDSLLTNKKSSVAFISVITTIIQFTGYGLGFLKGLLSNKN